MYRDLCILWGEGEKGPSFGHCSQSWEQKQWKWDDLFEKKKIKGWTYQIPFEALKQASMTSQKHALSQPCVSFTSRNENNTLRVKKMAYFGMVNGMKQVVWCPALDLCDENPLVSQQSVQWLLRTN